MYEVKELGELQVLVFFFQVKEFVEFIAPDDAVGFKVPFPASYFGYALGFAQFLFAQAYFVFGLFELGDVFFYGQKVGDGAVLVNYG